MTARLRIGLLGLGEAGAALASGLVGAGCDVAGFDPADPPVPEGVLRARDERDAVRDADVVLSVNAAAVALDVADAAGGALSPGQLYADLNTASAGVKLALQRAVAPSGALFADVALLGAVPRTGLRTPALASGTGAGRFADVFRPLGMPVDVVGEEAGAAAARKLVRSVFMKGLAASIVESLEAAAACDLEEWLREEIVRALDTPGAQLLERLVSGTQRHAARRRDEMAAAAELLSELGVEPRIALAAEALLEDVGRARAGGESGARPARS